MGRHTSIYYVLVTSEHALNCTAGGKRGDLVEVVHVNTLRPTEQNWQTKNICMYEVRLHVQQSFDT